MDTPFRRHSGDRSVLHKCGGSVIMEQVRTHTGRIIRKGHNAQQGGIMRTYLQDIELKNVFNSFITLFRFSFSFCLGLVMYSVHPYPLLFTLAYSVFYDLDHLPCVASWLVALKSFHFLKF